MPVRCRCTFSGQVQGVGFRATAVSVARGFDVAGSVRNLPDGRVELAAEGEPNEVDAFLTALRDRMAGHIREFHRHDEPPRGETGFRIER